MLLFLIFIMASALAPNLHSHLIFRFFAGFFGSTPLSCAGGTVADLWDPAQKAYAFPAYAIPAFSGPMIGQIIGSYIPTTLGCHCSSASTRDIWKSPFALESEHPPQGNWR